MCDMTYKDIISSKAYAADHREKMRSPSTIRARYEQEIAQYKELMRAQVDPREQRVMLYAEIKVLGWVLGKSDQTIAHDIKF